VPRSCASAVPPLTVGTPGAGTMKSPGRAPIDRRVPPERRSSCAERG
jgi:hypothetical protein